MYRIVFMMNLVLTAFTFAFFGSTPALAQASADKPNILFIMGDDIGWMQPSIYHRGLMVGETPTVLSQLFSSLDWVPTFVDIAGGPTGDGRKKQIETGAYPGIVKTTLDGFDQRDYLEGKSDKSARDVFFYYTGPKPSAVRYMNWKMYYTMVPTSPTGAMQGPVNYSWTIRHLDQ